MGSIERLPHPAYTTLLSSAARTATTNTSTQYNDAARGVILTLAVSSVTATPALTVTLQYSYDNGTTWVSAFAATAAVATAVTSSYLVYPGIENAADGAFTESVALPLPRVWRVSVVHADADSATYALYAQFL